MYDHGMNKRFSIMAIALLTVSGCGIATRFVPKSGAAIVGSGHANLRSINTAGVTSVKVASIVEVVIIPEGQGGSTLEADDNLLPNVITEVKGSQLVIRTTGSIEPKTPLRVTLRSVSIDKIEAAGASRIVLNNEKPIKLSVSAEGACQVNLNGPLQALELDLKGASGAEAPKLSGGVADVTLDGASHLTMGGTLDSLTAKLNGASVIRLPETIQQAPSIEAKGASRVEMSAEQQKSIHPNLSGASRVGERIAPTPPTPPTEPEKPTEKTNESR